jgi:putative effector of murein hydrolase LrgA (UPF0299 family)
MKRAAELLLKIFAIPIVVGIVLLVDWLGLQGWIGFVVLACSTVVSFALIVFQISRLKE